MPEGHSAMDKTLSCHIGRHGLKPDTTKVFSACNLRGTTATCSLSLSLSLSHTHTKCLSSCAPAQILVKGEVKRNPGKILAAPSAGAAKKCRQNETFENQILGKEVRLLLIQPFLIFNQTLNFPVPILSNFIENMIAIRTSLKTAIFNLSFAF